MPRESIQSLSDASQEESSAHKARAIANDILVRNISLRIKGNASVDLLPFLQQQVEQYPQLCNSLAQSISRRKSTSSCSDASTENGDGESSAVAELLHFQLKGDISIIQPLDSSIIALTTDQQNLEGAQDELLVPGLNYLIAHSQVLWRLHSTAVLEISPSSVVKVGTSIDLDSITNLQYINQHAAGIPAPSSLGALRCGRWTYALMSRAAGETLETAWPRLVPSQKLSVQQQLNTIFTNLRSNSPDDASQQYIGSFTSRRCKDMRRNLREATKPVQTEENFNDFLCDQPRRTKTSWIQMVRPLMSASHRLVMTHGDVHPRNIMVEWDTHHTDRQDDQSRIRITA
ncbi:hypothetical protein NLU13_6793 [Sarocladium strictum]|uniref:Aminoglycoside phosphotransferase domain-containing protein n=1 Tax=Sarocladium strictum TaxID=5046 RepID=A0AA39GEL7_SARSR|nr:hypothetical protein NLU13_6793 [Sarocladium strictum]